MASGTILAGAPALAQTYDPNYPFCMQVVSMDGGLYIDCSFTSMAQCQATASGLAGQCLDNPRFAYPYKKPRRQSHRHYK